MTWRMLITNGFKKDQKFKQRGKQLIQQLMKEKEKQIKSEYDKKIKSAMLTVSNDILNESVETE